MVEKLVGKQQRLPGRNLQTASPIELRARTFIEQEIRPLEVVHKFRDIQQAVVGLNKNRLRAAAQLLDESRNFRTGRFQNRHEKPHRVNAEQVQLFHRISFFNLELAKCGVNE